MGLVMASRFSQGVLKNLIKTNIWKTENNFYTFLFPCLNENSVPIYLIKVS